MTAGLVWISFQQWQTSEKQRETSDRLTELELSKAKPIFALRPLGSAEFYGLPKFRLVTNVNTGQILSVDADMNLIGNFNKQCVFSVMYAFSYNDSTGEFLISSNIKRRWNELSFLMPVSAQVQVQSFDLNGLPHVSTLRITRSGYSDTSDAKFSVTNVKDFKPDARIQFANKSEVYIQDYPGGNRLCIDSLRKKRPDWIYFDNSGL